MRTMQGKAVVGNWGNKFKKRFCKIKKQNIYDMGDYELDKVRQTCEAWLSLANV